MFCWLRKKYCLDVTGRSQWQGPMRRQQCLLVWRWWWPIGLAVVVVDWRVALSVPQRPAWKMRVGVGVVFSGAWTSISPSSHIISSMSSRGGCLLSARIPGHPRAAFHFFWRECCQCGLKYPSIACGGCQLPDLMWIVNIDKAFDYDRLCLPCPAMLVVVDKLILFN